MGIPVSAADEVSVEARGPQSVPAALKQMLILHWENQLARKEIERSWRSGNSGGCRDAQFSRQRGWEWSASDLRDMVPVDILNLIPYATAGDWRIRELIDGVPDLAKHI